MSETHSPRFGRYAEAEDGKAITISATTKEMRWRWFRRVPVDVTKTYLVLDGQVVIVESNVKFLGGNMLDQSHPLHRQVLHEVMMQRAANHAARVARLDEACDRSVHEILEWIGEGGVGPHSPAYQEASTLEAQLLEHHADGLTLLACYQPDRMYQSTPAQSCLDSQSTLLRRLLQNLNVRHRILTREPVIRYAIEDDVEVMKSQIAGMRREDVRNENFEAHLAKYVKAASVLLAAAQRAHAAGTPAAVDAYASIVSGAWRASIEASTLFLMYNRSVRWEADTTSSHQPGAQSATDST